MVKPIEPPEIKEIARLFQQLPREELLIYKTDVEESDPPEAWFLNPYYRKDVNLVAKVDHEVVAEGTIHSEGIYWQGAAELRIVIHPDYRGMGIGRALAKALIQEGIRLGFKRVVIRYRPQNTGLIKIFQALGIDPESSAKLLVQEDVSGIPTDLIVTLFNIAEWVNKLRSYLDYQALRLVTR